MGSKKICYESFFLQQKCIKKMSYSSKHDNGKSSSGMFAEAASFGELDVLATLWADPKNFAGKVVIDITNPPRKLVFWN